MAIAKYTEYEKQTDETWLEQHPKTDSTQIIGPDNMAIVKNASLVALNGFKKMGDNAFEVTKNAMGNFCVLNCVCSGVLTAGVHAPFAQLPAGFYPQKGFSIVVVEAGRKIGIEVSIDAKTGIIEAFRPDVTGTAYIYFTATYYC